MDKEKRIKIILAFLIVAAVFVWSKGCRQVSVSETSSDASQSFLTQTELSSLLAMNQGQKSSARSVYPAWGRNPFVLETSQNARKFILNGILWDDQKPQALIGDHIVGKGDTIGSSVVIDIRQDSVILNNGIEDWELGIGEGE